MAALIKQSLAATKPAFQPTALMLAAQKCWPARIKALHLCGAAICGDINTVDPNTGHTALHMVAELKCLTRQHRMSRSRLAAYASFLPHASIGLLVCWDVQSCRASKR